MNIFEKATKTKLRFDTTKGLLSVEDLWEYNLTSLDTIAKGVNKKLKEESEESFIQKKSKSNVELELKLEILKHIIKSKQDEAEVAKNAAEKKAKIEFLEELLQEKKIDELKGKTAEEIQAQLAELKS